MLKTKKQSSEDVEALEMCRRCYAFKYDDSWHFEQPDYLSLKDANEQVNVRFSTCTACLEEALAIFDVEYV